MKRKKKAYSDFIELLAEILGESEEEMLESLSDEQEDDGLEQD